MVLDVCSLSDVMPPKIYINILIYNHETQVVQLKETMFSSKKQCSAHL